MADIDPVVQSGAINSASLHDAYEFILRTLQENQIRSTAAFVTCFAAEVDLLREQIPLIEQLAALCPEWFCSILPVLRKGDLDGWQGTSFYRSMSSAGFEMAWHGATHVPLTDETPDLAVTLEMELASRIFKSLGHKPKTIIFPRNAPGHLPQLHTYGFDFYRARAARGKFGPASRLANEWNVWDRGSTDRPIIRDDGWCVSPAGYFLNWPAGARGLIPVAVTVMRWKSILTSAVRQSGYVHMWLHTHNIITAPKMKIAFAEIARFAGELIRSGDLVSLTIDEANKRYKQRASLQ